MASEDLDLPKAPHLAALQKNLSSASLERNAMIWQGKFKMEPNCFPSFAASDALTALIRTPSLHFKLFASKVVAQVRTNLAALPNIVRVLWQLPETFPTSQIIKSSNSVHHQILQTWIKSCKLGSTLDQLWTFIPSQKTESLHHDFDLFAFLQLR